MTVCGGWSLQKHEGSTLRAITLFCRSWQCADCMPFRLRALKRMAGDGNPSTFITLTVNPAHGQSPEARARELSDAWRIVVKRARRKFPKAPIEYFAVFEETKKGEPHLHILARAPFIPQKWLSAQMMDLIEAPIVDIRRVHSKRHAANYVAKYVGKGPRSFGSLKRYWQTPRYVAPRKRVRSTEEFPSSAWIVIKRPLWDLANMYRVMGFDFLEASDTRIWISTLRRQRAGPVGSWPAELTPGSKAS